MLRAEAAVFTPKELPTECGETSDDVEKGGRTYSDDASTVAPSPTLKGYASPVFSPHWGMSQEAMWAAAMWNGYPPEFSLEEGNCPDEGGYAYGRSRAMTMPAYIDEFTLEGVGDLQASLAGFLKDIAPGDATSQHDAQDSQESTSAGGMSLPPGLAPPPGLEAPPGLDLDAPPGLLGMKKGRDRTATWSHPEKSPLAPGTTTAMLRNIPNKYTQVGLVERLHEGGYRELDFIYLPIDFKNKCNVGYAFLNFRTAEACARFACEYHLSNSRDKLPGYNSKKVCEVSAARFQGCDENVRRIQVSSVMGELLANPQWLPQLFDESGEGVAFPVPDVSNDAAQPGRSTQGRLQRRKA